MKFKDFQGWAATVRLLFAHLFITRSNIAATMKNPTYYRVITGHHAVIIKEKPHINTLRKQLLTTTHLAFDSASLAWFSTATKATSNVHESSLLQHTQNNQLSTSMQIFTKINIKVLGNVTKTLQRQ